jgi:hypothetical protein
MVRDERQHLRECSARCRRVSKSSQSVNSPHHFLAVMMIRPAINTEVSRLRVPVAKKLREFPSRNAKLDHEPASGNE